jgi:hypothetical protein
MNALKIVALFPPSIGAYRGYTRDVPLTNTATEHFTQRVGNVAYGAFLNTLLFPICFYNTARRVEIHLKGLKNEKTKAWYNDWI